MKRLLIITMVVLIGLLSPLRADEWPYHFTVATYNVLLFPKAKDETRGDAFVKVMSQIPSDLLVVQNIKDSAAVDSFRTLCLPERMLSAEWSAVEKNEFMLFYNSEKFNLIRTIVYETGDRPIIMYHLQYKSFEQLPDIFIATFRLKTGESAEDKAVRLEQVNVMLADLEANLPGEFIILAGDIRANSSNEPHYQTLTKDSLFFDPTQSAGVWHDKEWASLLHTQSTRTTQFGGGATGGLDDRWDQILLSNAYAFPQGWGWGYIRDSYLAFGNDGDHLNKGIDERPNWLIEDDVAQALYAASDRLPVLLEIEYMERIIVEDYVPQTPVTPLGYNVVSAFPSPFNSSTTIHYSVARGGMGSVSVSTIEGREVANLKSGWIPKGEHSLTWDCADLAPGAYFVSLKVGNLTVQHKVIHLK